MNLHSTISYLGIGQVGTLPISVPITTFGNGSPHLSILCGVHGDETASLVICRDFVRELSQHDSLHGTVSIITAANPHAQSIGIRVSNTDYYDLNRMGQGKADGVLTERLAHRVLKFLLGCSFVIDLHEFEMDTPTMAIYIPSDKPEIDQQALKGINAFSPPTVWTMNLSTSEEMKYSGSLLAVLIRQGIAGFAVETSRAVSLSSEDIRKVAEGLAEVAKLLGITDGKPKMKPPIAFIRNVKYADQAGIWTPTASLMGQVREGEKIGEITSLNLVEHSDILATTDGTIIQLRSSNLVGTGTSLFTIGVKNQQVSDKLQSAI